MDPKTPPKWESSQLEYESDQETPRKSRAASRPGPSATRSARSVTKYDPYRVPTPAQRPRPMSRSVSQSTSPTPSRTRKRSQSAAPAPEGDAEDITGFSDDELDRTIKDAFDYTKPLPPPKVPKDLDLNTGHQIFGTPTFTPTPHTQPLPAPDPSGSNPSLLIGPAHPGPAPFPVTLTPPKPWMAEAERLQAEIAQQTEKTTESTRFQEHVSKVKVGGNELFPGNERLKDATPHPAPASEPTPIPVCQLPEDGSDMRSWLNAITSTVNGIVERQEQLHHLLIHSIAQNNVVASFNATATSNIENRLTLGAKGNLPSGYIVSFLWVVKQFARLIPSG